MWIARCLWSIAGLEGEPLNFSMELEALGRFRVESTHRMGRRELLLHRVKTEIPELGAIGGEPALWALPDDGLVLLTGDRRKRLEAALVAERAASGAGQLVTIERAVAYLHRDDAPVTQLEIGADTRNAFSGLSMAARLDPDCIVLDEASDVRAIRAALELAGGGHVLVMIGLDTRAPGDALAKLLAPFVERERPALERWVRGLLQCVLCLDSEAGARRLGLRGLDELTYARAHEKRAAS